MGPLFARAVACMLLAVFVASIASWTLQAKALAHEMEHQAGTAHSHDGPDDDDDDDDDFVPGPHGDHSVLHALGHMPVATLMSLVQQPLVGHGIVRAFFEAPRVERAAAEAPFRPPRTSIPA